VREELPRGTVTFLFTDVEGSTRLLDELGAEAYAAALAVHRRLIREACSRRGGVEVDTQGDAFFFAFPTAPGALEAARLAADALAAGRIRVRIGLHTGTPLVTDEGYVGDDVHLAARVGASGHGGQILVSGATAALATPSDTVSQGGALLDLGEHRLEDIAEPVSIFQLGDGSFPPLKTISNTNLPRPASSFVGRERELGEVLSRVERGARLVTLTGPGGSGKTRLAIEAAASLVLEHKAGVFWVGLSTLRDRALVTETIAQTLGARDGLAEHIGEREMLLLLDNFEQVVEAAQELSALAAACPNLRLLVTSRELLRVQGEVEYPVPPLAEPEAVALFCERSRLEPTGEIAELCARLDNLPLAVELAAARTKALSPAQILERISQRLDLLKGGRDADPRQQTLRATIEWSYDLLTEEEQRLFARLSVFAGGSTLDAAEDVVDADLDTVQSLVEKSLLRFTDERYWMLETIREFAGEQLEDSGEGRWLTRKHAEWLLVVAGELAPHVAVEREWLDRVEEEHDNVRAALDGLGAGGDTQLALRLAEAVWRFWKVRGHDAEGQRRLEFLLASDTKPTSARAHALNAVAGMAVDNGDHLAGRGYAEEAHEIHRKQGDRWGTARSVYMLGYAAIESGEFEAARPLFEEALRLMGEIGAVHYVGLATFNLAWALEELGHVERANALAEEGLLRARSQRNLNNEGMFLALVAGFAEEDGRLDEALYMKQRMLQITVELGDIPHTLDNLGRIASSHARGGRAERAARLLAASLALHEEMGLSVPLYQARRNEETVRRMRLALDETALAKAWQVGGRLALEEAVALALDSLG
jgi:predicted ATPase/class 3 adenylate cyclase